MNSGIQHGYFATGWITQSQYIAMVSSLIALWWVRPQNQ